MPAPDVDALIGWGWIYVLNARAAIERGRPWQAERWISAVPARICRCIDAEPQFTEPF